MSSNFLVIAVMSAVICPAKNLYRKRKVLKKIHDNLTVSIGMNHWQKARNEARRIARVKYL
jgi:hypothetical protein